MVETGSSDTDDDWKRLSELDDALRSGRDLESVLQQWGSADQISDPEFTAILQCLKRIETVWPRTASQQDETATPALPGTQDVFHQLGRFEIRKELGRGAFGVVVLAHDPTVNRVVALKLPRVEALLNHDLRERFIEEARTAARLDHPNVVPIYEMGEIDGICYISSAYCEGGNLADWLKAEEKPVEDRIAALIVKAVALAVQHAHDHGILHRDLKPSNVLLAFSTADPPSGELPFVPRLSDFGLAKVLEQSFELTGTSVLVGTPLYMSPEQAEGTESLIGPQSDVYAIGAILYELLTRHTPFEGTTVVKILDQIRFSRPLPLRTFRPNVSRDLEVICQKCLEREPSQRYGSAVELATDLDRFLSDCPIAARPLSIRQKLGNWCRRPARVRDAGYLTIAVGVGMIVWILLLSGFQYSGFAYKGNENLKATLVAMVAATVTYLPELILGYWILKRHRAAIVLSIIVATILCLSLALSWLGLIFVDTGGMFPTPSSRISTEALIFVMHILVIAANLVAYVSLRANPRLSSQRVQ